MPTRDECWELLTEWTLKEGLRTHALAVEAAMRWYAEKLGADYIFSLKPNPADLAMPNLDEDRVRRDLRRVFEITRGCRVEAIMKDCHTIGNNPANVVRWSRIAREEADRAGD